MVGCHISLSFAFISLCPSMSSGTLWGWDGPKHLVSTFISSLSFYWEASLCPTERGLESLGRYDDPPVSKKPGVEIPRKTKAHLSDVSHILTWNHLKTPSRHWWKLLWPATDTGLLFLQETGMGFRSLSCSIALTVILGWKLLA